jgi:hypothetical protein
MEVEQRKQEIKVKKDEGRRMKGMKCICIDRYQYIRSFA